MKDSLQRMKSDGSSRSCASDASRSSKSKRHSHKVQHPPKPTAGSTNVNKLFWLFTMLFLAIHHSLEILFAPEGSGPEDPNFDPASPKHRTCVLTDKGYFCSEDEKEARRHARPTPEYYVTNFGVAQTVDGNGDENRKMTEVERNMNNYMSNWIMNNSDDLCRQCQNKHDKCVFWASIGECSKNPSFMTTDCRLACQACDALKDADD